MITSEMCLSQDVWWPSSVEVSSSRTNLMMERRCLEACK